MSEPISDRMRATIMAKPDYSGLPLDQHPAFEFITGDRYFAIYADGRVVGADPEEGLLVINRIPMMINAG